MAHELDFSKGRAAIAYAGETPWHGLGTVADPSWSLDQWIAAAGINYNVDRVPVYAPTLAGDLEPVAGAFINRRSDTGAILGTQTHTERRVEVQPYELAKFVHDYVSTDDRFHMEVMGAIKHGAQIWATARFNGDMDVAGEKHNAFLLARTGFDGSLATHFQLTVVRAVCANTLAAAFADKRAVFTLRHSTKFDPKVAAKQLADMAASVDTFKAVGDALVQNAMAESEVVALFKRLLDIPEAAKSDDVSTRKLNQFNELAACYDKSVKEGAATGTAWAALQAVTRYVDHERSVRGDDTISDQEKRFSSSQFGSGDALKGKTMGILMPRIRDKVPVLVAA